jgi:hypothetical protein
MTPRLVGRGEGAVTTKDGTPAGEITALDIMK